MDNLNQPTTPGLDAVAHNFRWTMASITASVADADEVLITAATAYRVALGGRLIGAYALGSLAHGGFSPLVSDIDLGLVVRDPLQSDDAQTIELIATNQKKSGAPLADRLSVFWGTPRTLAGRLDGGRLPALDRLDLIESGRLLMGLEARTGLPRPSAAELLTAGAEFALDFLAGTKPSGIAPQSTLGSMRPAGDDTVEEIRRPELLVAAGVRRLTKLVLFPVRFMFTAATARVGTNKEAVGWHIDRAEAPAKSLVAAALAWRAAEPEDYLAATDLLRQEIVPLYLYYIDDHIRRLDSLGKVDLARAFRKWRDHLRA